eukprot:363993-Chlamydomonas_euryale.AAC.4
MIGTRALWLAARLWDAQHCVGVGAGRLIRPRDCTTGTRASAQAPTKASLQAADDERNVDRLGGRHRRRVGQNATAPARRLRRRCPTRAQAAAVWRWVAHACACASARGWTRWTQLSVVGCGWSQLGAVGCSAVGYGWVQLGAAGRCWVSLGAVGHGWMQLGAAGRRWVQLGAVGHRRMWLVVGWLVVVSGGLVWLDAAGCAWHGWAPLVWLDAAGCLNPKP